MKNVRWAAHLTFFIGPPTHISNPFLYSDIHDHTAFICQIIVTTTCLSTSMGSHILISWPSTSGPSCLQSEYKLAPGRPEVFLPLLGMDYISHKAIPPRPCPANLFQNLCGALGLQIRLLGNDGELAHIFKEQRQPLSPMCQFCYQNKNNIHLVRSQHTQNDQEFCHCSRVHIVQS